MLHSKREFLFKAIANDAQVQDKMVVFLLVLRMAENSP
jgi:hypothetical protein